VSEAVAAIDLGTNTALCLIARHDDAGGFVVVEDHCRTPRLGENLLARGTLDPAAVERALEALLFFAGRVRAARVAPSNLRAVSTAVLRRAGDGPRFVELALERTGIAIEIVSGDEEARLGELAVAAEGVTPDTVVVDVGGGSTEVSCTALGFRRSLAIGAVVLAESSPVESYLERAADAARELPLGLARDRDVVVLGGTGVNLACLARGFARFDHERAEGSRLAAADARAWAQRLAPLPLQARLGHPIEPERAFILPAGMSVLGAVLERMAVQSMRVTGRGLRFGVARELLARRGRQ
jgi:exopolyphosphatase/guanosine-5'-triphosphate,3'-diphosphate pyrophosphatase